MHSGPLIPSAKKLPLPEADAYIFDIDGTLLVTKDLVHWNALHQAMLEAYGVDTTIEGIPYHGKTDLSILRAALEREGIRGKDFEARLPRALEVVCREVELNFKDIAPQVCPGIVQLLKSLHGASKLLGVASGNVETSGTAGPRCSNVIHWRHAFRYRRCATNRGAGFSRIYRDFRFRRAERVLARSVRLALRRVFSEVISRNSSRNPSVFLDGKYSNAACARPPYAP